MARHQIKSKGSLTEIYPMTQFCCNQFSKLESYSDVYYRIAKPSNPNPNFAGLEEEKKNYEPAEVNV